MQVAAIIAVSLVTPVAFGMAVGAYLRGANREALAFALLACAFIWWVSTVVFFPLAYAIPATAIAAALMAYLDGKRLDAVKLMVASDIALLAIIAASPRQFFVLAFAVPLSALAASGIAYLDGRGRAAVMLAGGAAIVAGVIAATPVVLIR